MEILLYVVVGLCSLIALYYIGLFIFMYIAMRMVIKTLGEAPDVDK